MARLIAGDLCPPRGRCRAARPPQSRTTSRGPDRGPGFFDALETSERIEPEPRAHPDADAPEAGSAARSTFGTRTFSAASPTSIQPQQGGPQSTDHRRGTTSDRHAAPKTEKFRSGPPGRPGRGAAARRGAARPPRRGGGEAPPRPALQTPPPRDLERLPAPRAGRGVRDPGGQRLREVDPHPARVRPPDPRRGSR